MMIKLVSPKFILPLTVLIGILVMGTRMADMWSLVATGKLNLHPAQAEDSAAVKPPVNASPATKPTEAAEPVPSLPPPDADASQADMDILKQLATRRDELDKRARDMDSREALLKVTEQRVDQKIKEMETLRQQLQGMVNQASEAQQAQIDNLVKIYETMKPDEAARIFEALDMPILIGVIQHMKPKSTAPIMAKMAPEKARDLTVALTKQDQLPQIK